MNSRRSSPQGRRPKIPPKVADIVMVRARRRCCICFHLDADLSVKELQIAHLDRNRTNNAEQNLVALCLPHHDAYDARRRQTRNYTAGEVQIYREELDAVFAKRNETLVMRVNSALGEGSAHLSSADILGRVVDAYDQASASVEKGERPNGIALKHLAKVALEEEGDFPAAAEAMLSTVRLATSHDPELSVVTGLNVSFAWATPFTAARDILLMAAGVDLVTAHEFSLRLKLNALVEGGRVLLLDDYSLAPAKSFGAVVSILQAVSIHREAAKLGLARETARDLLGLAVGCGVIFVGQGTKLPGPPESMWMRIDGSRWVPDGESTASLQFVQVCHALATVPDEVTMGQPEVGYRHPVSFSVGNAEPVDRAHIPAIVRRWAPLPWSAIVAATVRTREDVEAGNRLIVEANQVGTNVEQSVRAFVAKERELIRTQTEIPIAGTGGTVTARAGAFP